ncbi:hypothetical protein LRA02_05280 [Lentilactobacillus rapi]|uniref:Uncharacterized protein n=1 Tax=Lentilactobacillus rapi TaxID=481723 RepID=A0A512PKD6_9LACO|nr:hypothetical protein LRA02_05280 [Lentilactobacillus rapi]
MNKSRNQNRRLGTDKQLDDIWKEALTVVGELFIDTSEVSRFDIVRACYQRLILAIKQKRHYISKSECTAVLA